jgi:hypothetical protein
MIYVLWICINASPCVPYQPIMREHRFEFGAMEECKRIEDYMNMPLKKPHKFDDTYTFECREQKAPKK